MHLKSAGNANRAKDQGHGRHQIQESVEVLKGSTQVLLSLLHRVHLKTQLGQL